MISILITGKDGTYDATDFHDTVTLSGDYKQCSRSLSFNLIEEEGKSVINCDVGNSVVFKEDDKVLFDGFIVSRQKTTDSPKIQIKCFDRGFYLKKNKGVYKFSNQTPESIVKKICSDFGISVGEVATTDVPVSRNFIGVSLYEIIMTAYTLASEKTKESYLLVFKEDKLCVIEKKVNESTLLIEPGGSLMASSCTESIENMINQVVIYDKDDKVVKTLKKDELISLYGLMQSYIKQGDDSAETEKKADKILEDNGYSQKITVESLGNSSLITGGTVVVKEPYTGVCGVFFIDTDTHTWKNGLYFDKLTLNFKNIMDEKEAGSLPKASSSSGSGTGSLKYNGYVNPPGEE